MKTKIANRYEKLRSSYWFLPLIMAFMSGALAFILGKLDLANEQGGLIDRSWISLAGAAGTRTILSTVASATITATATSCINPLGTLVWPYSKLWKSVSA